MLDYRIRIQLHSPTGTPWQSDTIFGHLVWQVALGRCDMAVGEFLAPFRANEPPFVLSDGFPAGLLPRPLIPPADPQSAQPRSVAEYAAAKRQRKAEWVTLDDFTRLCRGELAAGPPPGKSWVEVTTAHAALDRRNGRTGGEGSAGQLFETESRILGTVDGELDLYLCAVNESWAGRAVDLLREVSHAGFGRDKSVGLGAFAVRALEPFAGFPPLVDTNGFVSLSSFAPSPGDPVAGRWRLRVKRGKLGEPTAATLNPFKRPLLELEPGAVFAVEGVPRSWYGRLVEGLASSRPEAVQNGLTLAVPCRLAREFVREMRLTDER